MNYVNFTTLTAIVRGDRLGSLLTTIFYAVVCFIIYAGWCFSEYGLMTAEQGTGYYFGITGTVMMLLLGVYPMRKRMHALAFLGSNKLWFGLHIVFGIVGPVFILFHTNFVLGSLNSQVALFSMITVALSGVVGRYIYVSFHYGLTERKVNMTKLLDDLEHEKEELSISQLFKSLPEARVELFEFAEKILKPPGSLVNSIGRIVVAGWRAQLIHWKMRRIIRTYLRNIADDQELTISRQKQVKHQFRDIIRRFFTIAFRVTKLNFYERAFALWHVLHIPLVFLMGVAVVVHVIAVHLF